MVYPSADGAQTSVPLPEPAQEPLGGDTRRNESTDKVDSDDRRRDTPVKR